MSRFIDGGSPESPYAFIQWKSTDACFDFYCECGAQLHFDGYYAHFILCTCGEVWEMPHYVAPRKYQGTGSVKPLEALREE